MYCKDKELVINGKVVRSPEQQVYKNMEDIAELKTKLQTWYTSSVELNDSDNTILRSNTNVPDDVSSGLLIDPVGKMFSITGGDDTTLLITFYANIQGPQGETGTPGASSNDKGTYITHVEPTLNDGIYTLSTGNIDNFSTDSIPVQVNDIIIYIDSNDQPTSVYTVASISGTTLTLSKQGDYAKGKQLYMHSINLTENDSGSLLTQVTTTVITDDATPFTYDTFKQWLINNDFGFTISNWSTYRQFLQASGETISSGTAKNVYGIITFNGDSDHIQAIFINEGSGTLPIDRRNINKSNTNVYDKVTDL